MTANFGVRVVDRAAVCNAELLAYEIEASHFFRDGVFDLQARVDFEERNRAVSADEELARARIDVTRFAQDRLRRGVEALKLIGCKKRRWRLLDELLVTTLQRAVACGDDHHIALRIRKTLSLHVTRVV